MLLNQRSLSNSKLSALWIFSGCILVVIAIYISHTLDFYLLENLVRAIILGSTLVIIKHRRNIYWFLSTLILVILIFYLKNTLFPKWLQDVYLHEDTLSYSAGMFCIFYGLFVKNSNDLKIIKFLKIFASLASIFEMPILVIYVGGQVLDEAFAYFFPFIWAIYSLGIVITVFFWIIGNSTQPSTN